MAEYNLTLPVTINTHRMQANVCFMYDFDINNNLSIEIDKVQVGNDDFYTFVTNNELERIAQYIRESFYDWYDGCQE